MTIAELTEIKASVVSRLSAEAAEIAALNSHGRARQAEGDTMSANQVMLPTVP